jgi:hypothetical protein
MGESSTREQQRDREPRWLRSMPWLGAAAGGVFGVVVVWVAYVIAGLVAADLDGTVTRILAISLVLGIQGMLGGLVCGVAVGVVLTFLVGSDDWGPGAQRRAAAAAAVTHALTLGVLMAVIGFGFVGLGTLVLVGSTLVAGGVAWWFQGRLASRPHPDDVPAH